ncbi:MAG: alpha/beta fold hydrolase [Pseudomonas sp.]
MSGPGLETLEINGIRMRVARQGCGPLVLLCHGFPELWYSWRHQLAALAAAGYGAAAPDMRGYGGTDAPSELEAYSMLHLVGDMVELVQALGERQAVIVGHDWGAMVAWSAALLRPDLFRGVVGLSVPFSPPARLDPLSALERQGIHDFYIQYFQAPGVAETELEMNVEASLRRIYFNGSGDGPDRPAFGLLRAGQGFLADMIEPKALPAWLSHDDIAYYVREFSRSGFRGGLNWYRNIKRSWALLAAWRGCVIRQPSLFIAGARDAVLKFPGSARQIEAFAQTLPALRGCHILEGAGHWIQQERAEEVSELLLGFLEGL